MFISPAFPPCPEYVGLGAVIAAGGTIFTLFLQFGPKFRTTESMHGNIVIWLSIVRIAMKSYTGDLLTMGNITLGLLTCLRR